MRDNRIDTLRGIALINMFIYHGIYDLYSIFGYNIDIDGFFLYQQYICWSFIFISGFSTKYSNSKVKGFLVAISVAASITLVTHVFIPSEKIVFGIIHFFAAAFLIDLALGKFFRKIDPRVGAFVSIILFAITYNIPSGQILSINLPEVIYDLNLFFIGFPGKNFYSADYFPLLPWIFIFYGGVYLGKLIPSKKEASRNNPISLLGRHTLLFYIIHQPVILGILHLLI